MKCQKLMACAQKNNKTNGNETNITWNPLQNTQNPQTSKRQRRHVQLPTRRDDWRWLLELYLFTTSWRVLLRNRYLLDFVGLYIEKRVSWTSCCIQLKLICTKLTFGKQVLPVYQYSEELICATTGRGHRGAADPHYPHCCATREGSPLKQSQGFRIQTLVFWMFLDVFVFFPTKSWTAVRTEICTTQLTQLPVPLRPACEEAGASSPRKKLDMRPSTGSLAQMRAAYPTAADRNLVRNLGTECWYASRRPKFMKNWKTKDGWGETALWHDREYGDYGCATCCATCCPLFLFCLTVRR